jgi:hypothetical protein
MDGRFVNRDPIEFDGGDVNFYGYVHNNPTNSTDPLGLSESTTSCIAKCFIPFSSDISNYEKGPKAKLGIVAGVISRLFELNTCISNCQCVDQDCKCRNKDKIGQLQEYQPYNSPPTLNSIFHNK